MASRIERICGQPGCGNLTTHTYCELHHSKPANGTDRKAGRNWAAWERLRDYLRALGNVTCQRVDWDGIRCTRPVYLFHHVVDFSNRPDLELNWQNVVGVCKHCHPTPTAIDQGRYVPTLWRTPMSDETLPLIVAQPGQKVPKDLVLWTRANRLELFNK